jgi:hypothetical protein
MTHGQRSGSRHSFQQQLQQQLLQDLEESQEEEGVDGLPLPFSTRRRPDNDDMCSYATQVIWILLLLVMLLVFVPHRPSVTAATTICACC